MTLCGDCGRHKMGKEGGVEGWKALVLVLLLR